MYSINLVINEEIFNAYTQIKHFKKSYEERLIKAYALPFDTEENKKRRDAEIENIKVTEKNKITALMRTEDTNYRIETMCEEIVLELDTYAINHTRNYDSNNVYTGDVFYFVDSYTPVEAFLYLAKTYPCFMKYLDTITLLKDNTEILDFKILMPATC